MANLFTSQTPSVTDASDGTPGITTATTVRFTADGTVTGIRFFATTTVGGTYTVLLYQVTAADDVSPAGTLLASKTMSGSPTGGTWNSVAFDTPVTVVTNTLYRACLFSGAGRYVATLAFFTGALTNGNIVGDSNGDNPVGLGTLRQGTFAINAAATYPSGVASAASYFVDVEFSAGAAGVTGSGTLTLPVITATGAGVASASGSGALTLPAITATGAGTTSVTGSGSLTLPALTAAGAGTASATGSGTLMLPAITISGFGGEPADEVSAPGPVIRTSARDRTLRTSTWGG